MKRVIGGLCLGLALLLAATACGGGNTLWKKASPGSSVLEFYAMHEEGGWYGYLSDKTAEKEMLATLSAVKAERVTDWSPAQVTYPVYGVEIGTGDGDGILAAWSNGYLILRDGSVYRFDFDFGAWEAKRWNQRRSVGSVSALPCGRWLVQGEAGWIAEFLHPATQEPTGQAGVTLTVQSVTEEDAVLTVTNGGDEDWFYGEYFSLQVLLDGVWYTVPANSLANWGFTDLGYSLPAGETRELHCGLAMYAPLPAGNYRLVKEGVSATFLWEGGADD